MGPPQSSSRQRTIASNVVYSLFGQTITISNDYYTQTLYLPTCKVEITFSYSKEYNCGNSGLKVCDGCIENKLEPDVIIPFNTTIIDNVNEIFNKIAFEIRDGYISYSVESDSFSITVSYDGFSLTIKITPNSPPSSGTIYSELNKVTNSNWEKVVTLAIFILSVIPAFKPLRLIKCHI